MWHSCVTYACSTQTIGNSSYCKEQIQASAFTSCGSPSASPNIFSIFLMMATFWWARSGYSILLGVGAPWTNKSKKVSDHEETCSGKDNTNVKTLAMTQICVLCTRSLLWLSLHHSTVIQCDATWRKKKNWNNKIFQTLDVKEQLSAILLAMKLPFI